MNFCLLLKRVNNSQKRVFPVIKSSVPPCEQNGEKLPTAGRAIPRTLKTYSQLFGIHSLFTRGGGLAQNYSQAEVAIVKSFERGFVKAREAV